MPSCSSFLTSFRNAFAPEVAAVFRNLTIHADATSLEHAAAARRRKVWDLIPFGYELDMLWLHVRTLDSVVDGFLVTEATTSHMYDERKPTLLSDAIANGSVPAAITASKLRVRKVEFARERHRFCPSPHQRCYEALQRFLLLEMLFEVAAPEDLVLVGDVDEFAKPSVVSMLKTCYPFDPKRRMPAFLVLKLTLYKFGVHCDHGNTFEMGTRAFSAGGLMAAYGDHKRATRQKREEMSADFTLTRSRFHSAPSIPMAGWHLTSFGAPSELARKLRTFLHANIFHATDRERKGSLSEPRLERCMRYCLELDKPMVNGVMPPCEGRSDPKSRKLPGTLRSEIAGADLPHPLLNHRAQWPPAWFQFVDETPRSDSHLALT